MHKRDRLLYITIIISLAVVYWYSSVFLGDTYWNGDFRFVYNRACQMISCLKDLRLPFIYYNDLGGMGYGVPFFYGDLTLYPFLPFALISVNAFMYSYIGVMVIVFTSGAVFLTKRFTDNYLCASVLIMETPLVSFMLGLGGIYACFMAIGISFYFIGCLIDYLRHEKSFGYALGAYFLVFSTNTLAAAINFFICAVLILLYFDKEYILNYIGFFLSTCVSCVCYIGNILYHVDSMRSFDYMRDGNGLGFSSIVYASIVPIGGVVTDTLLPQLRVDGFKYVTFVMFGFILYQLVKYFKSYSIRAKVLLALCILGIISTINVVFSAVNNAVTTPLQFPVRYAIYAIIPVIILSVRNIKSFKLFTIIVLLCLTQGLCIPMAAGGIPYDEIKSHSEYFWHVVNGEFLGNDFCISLYDIDDYANKVWDKDGNLYDFVRDKDRLIVYVPEHDNDLVLTLPKIWYNGYKVVGADNQSFEVTHGVSNLVEVDIGKYSGELTLYYETVLLFWLYLYSIMFTLVMFIIEKRRPKVCDNP